ncbi:MAG: hypothetical protein HOW73_12665 [Polyangiaceae bacterium]|nr:hypothetical protein [Polyangiaceae bacterium]
MQIHPTPMRKPSWLIFTLSVGCTPAALPSDASIEPTPPVPTVVATLSAAPSSPATAPSEPEPEPTAEVERDPRAITSAEVCPATKDALLAVLRGYPKDFENASLGSVRVDDLHPEDRRADGTFGETAEGPGYWGPIDFDSNGVEDRVLNYTSVDFWSYLFFIRKSDCWAFSGYLEGYQVELADKGKSARVLTYPIGPDARIETYRFDGSRFVKPGKR